MSAVLGVAGVITSVDYADAGRQQVLDQIKRMGTNVLIITPKLSRSVGGRARTGTIVTTLVQADYTGIRRDASFVVRSSATTTAGFLLKHEDLSKNGQVVGCEPEYFEIKKWPALEGESFDETDLRRSARVVVLGYTVARDLFGKTSPIGARLAINRVPFQVVGVLAERGQGVDIVNEDNQVFIPLTTAQHRLMNIDYYSSILIEVDDWKHLDSAGQTLTSILGERHRVSAKNPADFQVQNQKTLLDNQTDASQRLSSLVRAVGVSGLFVSGLGILAICWISVKERSIEIGTRRALGANRSDIFLQILLEASFVSLAGSLMGIEAGWFATRVVATRVHVPFVFDLGNAYFAVAASVLMNVLFSLGPSRKAANLDPIRALKYE
jgi:putative ABC transport system permease protein